MRIDHKENFREETRGIQDHAYDLLGEMLLEEKVREIQEEMEAEKGTDAEKEMTDFFERHEAEHLSIIARNCARRNNGFRQMARTFPGITRAAAILVVCLALAGGAAIATSATVRIYIMRILASSTPEYTELSLTEDREVEIPEGWQGKYYLTQLPKNAFMVESQSSELYSQVVYIDAENSEGWEVRYSEYSAAFDVRIDTENTDSIPTRINGNEAMIAVKDELITVYWTDGQRILLLQTQGIPLKDTLEYAASIRLVK